ncbi:hypothetical protein BHYA_0057g00260 [Botrytis hyacinthi]|uniref:Uncharacterized protein n=1 Tax=Botrytis hyacinthi TaxID=278943 RepID=A0A4Z1GU59_9HELO|nr:hypothetical protein BHYA_0057g00260 [Botrytis hyacinthi]
MIPLYMSKYLLASPPRRFVVPEIVVTTATPMAPLLRPYQPPDNGSTETTTLHPPKHFAEGVTEPTSQTHSTLRPQALTAITLTPPIRFLLPLSTPHPTFPLPRPRTIHYSPAT